MLEVSAIAESPRILPRRSRWKDREDGRLRSWLTSRTLSSLATFNAQGASALTADAALSGKGLLRSEASLVRACLSGRSFLPYGVDGGKWSQPFLWGSCGRDWACLMPLLIPV